jgi:hypothetical protein
MSRMACNIRTLVNRVLALTLPVELLRNANQIVLRDLRTKTSKCKRDLNSTRGQDGKCNRADTLPARTPKVNRLNQKGVFTRDM